MALITVNELSAFYENKEVFSKLSFQIHKGDYLSILGENGSGKTTLMKCLLGFPVKHTGSVVFNGLSRKEIGWLPQRKESNKEFPASVEEVIMSGFSGKGLALFGYTKGQKQEARKNMELLEIQKLRNSAFEELSGGQQQKILLCRAMCSANKILLLDEPVTGLDTASQNELYSLIEKLNKNSVTIVMISHDVPRTVSHTGKILHLSENGYFFGTAEEYKSSKYYDDYKGETK